MKGKKKLLKKLTAIMLAITLMVTGINVNNKSNKIAANESNQTEKQSDISTINAKDAKVVKELKKERTENSNTYLMSDGSKRVECYGENIRYKEDGEYVDYDNTLKTTDKESNKELNEIAENSEIIDTSLTKEYTYSNETGDAKQYFAKTLSEDTPIVMEKDNYVIGFTPITEDSVSKEETTKEKTSLELEKIKEDSTNAQYKSEDNTLNYNYVSLTNGVKEDIVLNSKPESNVFEFNYEMDGLTAKLNKKTNNIELSDETTGKLKACIVAPYVIDKKANISYDDVSYKIDKEKNGSYKLKVSVNEKYLEKASYPVTIDPTVQWVTSTDKDAMGITYAIELDGAGDYYQYINAVNRFVIGRSGAGDYYKTFIKLPNIAKDVEGKYINYAYANFSIAQQIGGAMNVNMHEITEDWELTTLNAHSEPAVSDEILSTSTIGIENEPYAVDFTKYMTKVSLGKADA